MKLAVTQVVLGLLIVFFSFFIVAEGFMTEYNVPMPDPLPQGYTPFITIEKTPGFFTGLAILSTFFLGLAVTGTGIAQLVRSRRKRP